MHIHLLPSSMSALLDNKLWSGVIYLISFLFTLIIIRSTKMSEKYKRAKTGNLSVKKNVLSKRKETG